ncbi:MAG: alanine--tRNA ligase [Thermoplasmatales archaeon]
MSEKEEVIGYLKDNGYEKKTCAICGKIFWTLDHGRKTCGEIPCDPYSFIGNPPTNRKFTLEEMREEFLSFFEKNGHKRVKRYPIVARWREDVYLVNASIYDFQPHVTSGKVPPPGNPLVVSQPCIRTVDLDNVGKTGRHLSVFEMGGAKSFNFPGKEIYWKDKAIEYAVEFLLHLGVKREEIIFKEKPWAGGGNAGSSVEVMVRGLEVATLVFMDMVESTDGDVDIDGILYKKMDNRIVDTGYGIERLTWLSQGTDTLYEALYPGMVSHLMQEIKLGRPNFLREFINAYASEDGSEAKFLSSLGEEERTSLDKLSNIYILADHSRAITILLFDGLVPSNSKAGYVLRMLIRRALLARKKVGMEDELWDLIEQQKERFRDILDTRLESSAREIIRLETERFDELLGKGDGMIRKYSKGDVIRAEDVILLFESNGLPIEYVKERCEALGIKFPEKLEKTKGFSNIRKEQVEKKHVLKKKYPETGRLYYDDERIFEFNSRIIGTEDKSIILENTYFYPEGGGQPSDHGILLVSDRKLNVIDVKVVDGVILHEVDDVNAVSKGQIVHGYVSVDRRTRLMQNHTATHIILSSIRDILGPHIWQAGAQKDERVSRLDVTHFRDVTPEEISKIEERANDIVRMNLPLHKEFVNRNDAEAKFGFTLYQGGIPEGNKLRLVEIPGIDAEGCGGTHLDYTGEVGYIKIVKVERIQDGIIRFNFAAGKSAVEFSNSQGTQLQRIKEKLGEEPTNAFESINHALEETRKAIESGFSFSKAKYKNKEISIVEVDESIAEFVSRSLSNSYGIIISSEKVRIASSSQDVSALDIMHILESKGYVKGGGNNKYAQGKVLKQNLGLKEVEGAISDYNR